MHPSSFSLAFRARVGIVLMLVAVGVAAFPMIAYAAAVGPFEIDGPSSSYSWNGSTLTISGDDVTIVGMASPDAPAGAVVVEATVKTVGIGANVHIDTLTVRRSTTFVVSGSGNSVIRVDTARDDAVGGDGKITMDTGDAGVDVFDSAVLRVNGDIESAYVWEKATLVLGPEARVNDVITALGGILDLSQVVIGQPVPVAGVSVGNPSVTLAVVAPFGATDLHQLLDYQNLIVNDSTPVYENGEQIGTLDEDGLFDIPAMRSVTFVGFDGSLIETQAVRLFSAATAPTATVPEGYEFTGWNRAFDYVTQDMTVAALFSKLPDPEPEPNPEPNPEPEPDPDLNPQPGPQPQPAPSTVQPEGASPSGSSSAAGTVMVTMSGSPARAMVAQRALARTGDDVPLAAGGIAVAAVGALATFSIAVASARKRAANRL